MQHKSKELKNLYQLGIQEFPQYQEEISHLIEKNEFIEILQDYMVCQNALTDVHKSGIDKALYEQLMMELKQEMNLFIITHLK